MRNEYARTWEPSPWSCYSRQPSDEGPLPGEEDYHGPEVDVGSVDSQAWLGIGRRLYQGRKSRQISKREAARRAGISEALLAAAGGRRGGR